MSDANPDLTDFGARDSTPPPRIQRQHTIQTRQTYPHRVAGSVGPIPQRNTMGFLKECERAEHWYHTFKADAGGAYAISTDAFRRAKQRGANVVLVAESDTGDVYEWPLRLFDGQRVPTAYLEHKDDPQVYATIETADVWEDHASDVEIDPSVDLRGDYD